MVNFDGGVIICKKCNTFCGFSKKLKGYIFCKCDCRNRDGELDLRNSNIEDQPSFKLNFSKTPMEIFQEYNL